MTRSMSAQTIARGTKTFHTGDAENPGASDAPIDLLKNAPAPPGLPFHATFTE